MRVYRSIFIRFEFVYTPLKLVGMWDNIIIVRTYSWNSQLINSRFLKTKFMLFLDSWMLLWLPSKKLHWSLGSQPQIKLYILYYCTKQSMYNTTWIHTNNCSSILSWSMQVDKTVDLNIILYIYTTARKCRRCRWSFIVVQPPLITIKYINITIRVNK